ncbi:MAG: hypothetical protein WD004_02795 [Actinomycetota bacterium]
MRVARLAISLAAGLGLLLLDAPAVDAHNVKANANATITGTSVNGGTMTVDVRVRIKNRARKKRDIGCGFTIRRDDNNTAVGTGFAGAFIRGDRAKTIDTQVFKSDPGTNQLHATIDHCHTYN